MDSYDKRQAGIELNQKWIETVNQVSRLYTHPEDARRVLNEYLPQLKETLSPKEFLEDQQRISARRKEKMFENPYHFLVSSLEALFSDKSKKD